MSVSLFIQISYSLVYGQQMAPDTFNLSGPKWLIQLDFILFYSVLFYIQAATFSTRNKRKKVIMTMCN